MIKNFMMMLKNFMMMLKNFMMMIKNFIEDAKFNFEKMILKDLIFSFFFAWLIFLLFNSSLDFDAILDVFSITNCLFLFSLIGRSIYIFYYDIEDFDYNKNLIIIDKIIYILLIINSTLFFYI